MTRISEITDNRPWHREPWPWIIIGLLGTTVVASLVTLWIAVANPDIQVVDEEEYQKIRSEMRAQPAEGANTEDQASRADQGNG